MKNTIIVIVAVVVSFLAARELFPRTITEKSTIPVIVTVYDTVEQLPKWLEDSLRSWKKRKSTTDTVPLVIQTTHVDTEYVKVPCDTAERSRIRPVLWYHGGTRVGDTATVGTFSLRDGKLDASKVYIPGILTGIDADTNAAPKMTFEPFPEPKKPSLLYKLKLIGIGVGTGFVVTTLSPACR